MEKEKKRSIVVASGYFNPIHKGHVRYLQHASKLGDQLIVIVNNDKQVKIKGSKPFMDEMERIEVVMAIKGVYATMLSIDTDETVCKSLELLAMSGKKPTIFAKGGDRTINNIPEKEVCKRWRIKMEFGVGGGKVQSSSNLLKQL